MLSPAVAVAGISKVSPALTVPLRTLSPFCRVTGMGSPVSADSSNTEPVDVINAVDRNDLAGAHENGIADRYLRDGNVLDGLPKAPVRYSRCAIDEGLQVALGAGDGEILEHRAARVHDGDNDAGERLTERECGAHGQEGDGVNAEAPSR